MKYIFNKDENKNERKRNIKEKNFIICDILLSYLIFLFKSFSCKFFIFNFKTCVFFLIGIDFYYYLQSFINFESNRFFGKYILPFLLTKDTTTILSFSILSIYHIISFFYFCSNNSSWSFSFIFSITSNSWIISVISKSAPEFCVLNSSP
jgi:hypothetical protein